MHGSVGLHSALAIKRQRKAREEKRRLKERRLSSPHTSMSSLDHPRTRKSAGRTAPPDHRLNTSIGMLHLGVVFLVLGLFLIASGILPEDIITWKEGGWWNELVATGIFATSLGIFLICLNRVISKKEEDDLNEYVQSQLTRSRSGHRLERDTETGCLTTKHHRRALQMKKEDIERGLATNDEEELPTVHSPTIKTLNVSNGNAHLDKILEEEVCDKNRDDYKGQTEIEILNRETISTTTTASLSPGSPSETRLLITETRHPAIVSRIGMIGAMPAVAVRHERRRQEKRTKRPSQLYLGGPWFPPASQSPTPSPGNNGLYGGEEGLPEYYVCGKVSALQIVVGSLLLGAVVLVVGLVQLTPGAADADHRWILLGVGLVLVVVGLIMTAIRCCCLHITEPLDHSGHSTEIREGQNSTDVLVQRRNTQVLVPSELESLIANPDRSGNECCRPISTLGVDT